MQTPCLSPVHSIPLCAVSLQFAISPRWPVARVFYGSEQPETAVAEKAFHRLLFFRVPRYAVAANPGEYTAIAAQFATRNAIDLTQPPWRAHRDRWIHPTDYSACLDLSDGCRLAGLDAIRYESARDPASRANLALLTCRIFARRDVVRRQSWRLHFNRSGVRAICSLRPRRSDSTKWRSPGTRE